MADSTHSILESTTGVQASELVPDTDPTYDIQQNYPLVIDGLKKLYKEKIRPVEERYGFDLFHSALMRDSDFDAKPMVLLLGQYSTGKTSFIEYVLEREFPGQRIGPEPTTDRFVAVMKGDQDRTIPGNALAVDVNKPFHALNRMGNGFLSKFEAAECNAPILDKVMLVDTPGVLSGEKQRIGRSYDYVSVCEWFAERADLILLLFDAHKLDISDEFKRVIGALKGHDDKVRVVLNKADSVSPQQLMRVYGALMWSLGKVVSTPEVMRVYTGSFWSKPLHFKDNAKLFEAEQRDLLHDLRALPRNAALRKVNELVKRARLVKVHAYIISHLKNEMPAFFGKDSKKAELTSNLQDEFNKLELKYRLPHGDFPVVERFQQSLKLQDWDKFEKLSERLLKTLDEALTIDLPRLMMQISPPQKAVETNPFAVEAPVTDGWILSSSDKAAFDLVFSNLGPDNGKLSGSKVKTTLLDTGLSTELLRTVWNLADMDKDGALDSDEFALAMYLCEVVKKGNRLPDKLPANWVPASKKMYI
jgi:EH domain-containing protein 1